MLTLSYRVPGLSQPSLNAFLGRARRAAGVRGAVNVMVAGNRTLHALNLRFRKKNRPTDVLSFPATPAAAGLPEYAGDIAVSAQYARQSARRYGHSFGSEVKILVLHGLLHLAGYDHETDQGEMAREERRLRSRLGLPATLLERHAGAHARTTGNGPAGRGRRATADRPRKPPKPEGAR